MLPVSITSHTLPVLIDAGIKGVAVLALACVAAALLRRASAAARHLVWFLAMTSLLVLPVLSFALPGWRVLPGWAAVVPAVPSATAPGAEAMPAAEREPGAALQGGDTLSRAAPAGGAGAVSAAAGSVGEGASSATASAGYGALVLALWAAGAAVALVPLVLGQFSLRRLQRASRPVASGPWAAQLRRLIVDLGIRRRVTLLESGHRSMPMAWGAFRARLLLPAAAREWTPECLRVVLLHELAHVKRWDCLTQLLVRVARGLHWFNPLAWVGAHRATIEHERACDDLVLGHGGDAPNYAEHLLQVASRLPVERFAAAAAIAMARPSKLEGRLLAILDKKRNRRTLRAMAVALAVAGVVAVVVPLASLRPAAQAEPAAAPKPVASATPPAAAPAHPAVQVAEAFMKAVADGRDTDAADLYVPDEMHAGAAKRLRESLDLSAWHALQAWADADRACVITSVPEPKAGDARRVAFGISLIRSGSRWLLRDMDALPSPAEVNGFVAKFRTAVPKAVQVFPSSAEAPVPVPPGDLEKWLNLTPEQQARLRQWFKEQEGKGALSPNVLAGFLRTILDAKQRAILEQTISSPDREARRERVPLELRVVPNRIGSSRMPVMSPVGGDLGKDLAENGPEPGRKRGDEFQWFELACEVPGPLVSQIGEFRGRKHLLLCGRPPYAMPYASGAPDAWGVTDARVGKYGDGEAAVYVTLNDRGRGLLEALTQANRDNALAILVDGKVVSVVVIKASLGGRVVIAGRFTQTQANDLARALVGAELPAGAAPAAPMPATDAERQRLSKAYGQMMAIGAMFQEGVDPAISRNDRQGALELVTEILTKVPEFVAVVKGTPLEPFATIVPNETRRLQKALTEGRMDAARDHLDAIARQGTAAVDLCRELLGETSPGAAPASP